MIAILGIAGFAGSSLFEAQITRKNKLSAVDIVKLKGGYNWRALCLCHPFLGVVDASSKKRSPEVLVKFAEAFVLIKEIVK